MFHKNKIHKTNDNFLINIEGLPKEEVIIALFKNVYRKSKASRYTFSTIADAAYYGGLKVPVGTDYPPTKEEVRNILNEVNMAKKTDYIDYIGPVNFKIDFNKNTIDTKDYDILHRTNTTPDIKTAKECINELKKKYGIKLEQNSKEIMNTFSKEVSSALIKNNYFKFSNIDRFKFEKHQIDNVELFKKHEL